MCRSKAWVVSFPQVTPSHPKPFIVRFSLFYFAPIFFNVEIDLFRKLRFFLLLLFFEFSTFCSKNFASSISRPGRNHPRRSQSPHPSFHSNFDFEETYPGSGPIVSITIRRLVYLNPAVR